MFVIHSSFGKCDIDCCSKDILTIYTELNILKFPTHDGKEIRLLFILKCVSLEHFYVEKKKITILLAG